LPTWSTPDGFRVEPKPEDGKATIERWLAGGSLYD